jgi:ATP-dependent Clp protease adaptor protein ClpS
VLTLYKGIKMAASTDTKTKIKPNLALKEPPLYKIIYVNDNHTTMEFVVSSLVEYFHYTDETAKTITLDIHDKGSAVVAILPYEIAEQKGIEVTIDARSHGYPLQIKVEPETD